MKTREEFTKEILASEELKAEMLAAAKSKEALNAFLKQHDCDAGAEDFAPFLKDSASSAEGAAPLNDNELDAVSGGDGTVTGGHCLHCGSHNINCVITEILEGNMLTITRKFTCGSCGQNPWK